MDQRRRKEHECGRSPPFLPPHGVGGQWLGLKRRRVEEGTRNGIVFMGAMEEMVGAGDRMEGERRSHLEQGMEGWMKSLLCLVKVCERLFWGRIG
jgi:hypothetical protein